MVVVKNSLKTTPILPKILKSIWDEFVYGGHFLALGDALALYALGMILGIKVTWDFLLVIYLVVFASNLFNRVKEIEIDEKTNPERIKTTNRYLALYGFLMGIMYFGSVGIIVRFSRLEVIVFILIPVILALLYTTFFKPLTRHIIGFKSFVAALFYSLLVFFLASYFNHSLSTAVFLVFIFYYLRIFVSNAFCDFKDVRGDKSRGLKTLIVSFGEKNTVKLLNILNFLSAVPILIGVYIGVLPLFSLGIILTIFYINYCFSLCSMKNKEFLYNVIIDGEFIFWLPYILLGKLLLGGGA